MTREQTNLDELMWEKRIRFDKELADKMNLTPQTLYLRLKNNISMNTIELIASSLEVTVEDIIVKRSKFIEAKKIKNNPNE